MATLNNLPTIKGNTKKAKRRGRGFGSGKGGHTTGTGTKGQKAREGAKPNLWFEGGQTPIVRKLPFIHGFKNPRAYKIAELNLSQLEELSQSGEVINNAFLKNNGFNKKADFFKVLGTGKIKSKVNTEGLWFTKKAKEKIEKAGGTIK